MDIYLYGKLIVRCDECGAVYNIDTDSMDYDSICIDERDMGAEIEHDFKAEIDCNCGNCLHVKISGFEYPEGALAYQDSEAYGCSIEEEPIVEIEYELPEPVMSLYEQVVYYPQCVYKLEPYEFENLVADVYRRYDYDAVVTQQTRDGGKDIVATFEKGGVLYTTYFECKRYAFDRPVGVDVVRSLYGVMVRDKIDKGIIVTSSYFTNDAINEVKRINGRIQLIDYAKLQDLMRRRSDYS